MFQATNGGRVLLGWLLCLLSGSGPQMAAAKLVNDTVRMRVNYDGVKNWDPGNRLYMDGLHYVTHMGCDIGKTCSYEVKARIINLHRVAKRATSWKHYVWDEAKFEPLKSQYISSTKRNGNSPGFVIKGDPHSDPDSDPDSDEQVQRTAELNLRMILDTEWDQRKLNRNFFSSRVAGKECLSDIESKAIRQVHVPLDGTWSKATSGRLSQTTRPHNWYFVLEDCQANLVRAFSQTWGVKPNVFLPNIQIEYQMEFINTDGSYLSAEFRGMPLYSFLAFVISALASGYFISAQVKEGRRSTIGEVFHPLVYMVDVALVCYTCHLLFTWMNINGMNKGGLGYPQLDTFGVLLCTLSQITLITSCFAVALGFSLNVNGMTLPGEAFTAIALCYGFIELVLQFAQYKTYSFRYHLHMAQGVIPLLLATFRSLLAAGFYGSVHGTLNREDIHNKYLIVFLKKFRWRGFIVILGAPITSFIISNVAYNFNQQRYMFITRVLMDIATFCYLGFAFLTKKTSYFKASSMGSTDLPSPGVYSNKNLRKRAYQD